MSKFVNYKKRSVTLPPGCKDLVDVLHGPRLFGSLTSEKAQPTITRHQAGTVRLGQIPGRVATLFRSPADSALLMLSLPNYRLTIHFGRMTGEPPLGSVTFNEDAEIERLMRELFVARDLKLPRQDWTPANFVAGLPVQLIFSISPFPITATDTSNLILEILRCVFSVTDDSSLTFQYIEMANAA